MTIAAMKGTLSGFIQKTKNKIQGQIAFSERLASRLGGFSKEIPLYIKDHSFVCYRNIMHTE